MPQIVEMILYYIPITLVASFVYASIKRESLRDVTTVGFKYFVSFTGLILACVVVMELIPWLLGA